MQAYKLYGSELSLYSGKLRSYLRKKGLAFDEILPTKSVYKDVVLAKTGVAYIPVLETPTGEFLQDTPVIIRALEAAHEAHPAIPQGPKQRLVASLIELYADEWLVLPAMHYRWNFPAQNQPFIYQEFGKHLSPKAPGFIRGWVGKKIAGRFIGAVKKLGVTDATIPEIERSYQGLLVDLDAHFSKFPYLLGDKPSIADFGLIGPLYAHLYRDPMPGELMRQTAPETAKWVRRMISDEPSLQSGDWLPDDQIPATLTPILKRFATEQWPVLVDTNRIFNTWLTEQGDTDFSENELPRMLGMHEFRLGEVGEQRWVFSYSLWRLQRCLMLDFDDSLHYDPSFQAWLDDLGLADLLSFESTPLMTRVNNKLYLKK